MSDRKPTSVILPAVGAVLVLLGLYVGAYYWAVVVVPTPFFPIPTYDRFQYAPNTLTADPDEIGAAMTSEQRWCRFFAPIHQIDRHLRPHLWETKP